MCRPTVTASPLPVACSPRVTGDGKRYGRTVALADVGRGYAALSLGLGSPYCTPYSSKAASRVGAVGLRKRPRFKLALVIVAAAYQPSTGAASSTATTDGAERRTAGEVKWPAAMYPQPVRQACKVPVSGRTW